MPVLYNDKEYFRDPGSYILVSDSVIVDCETQGSIHYIAGHCRLQKSGEYEVIKEKVTVMKPTFPGDRFFPNKLPFHLGNMYGSAANDVNKALIQSVKRRILTKKIESGFAFANQDIFNEKVGRQSSTVYGILFDWGESLVDWLSREMTKYAWAAVISIALVIAIVNFIGVCCSVKKFGLFASETLRVATFFLRLLFRGILRLMIALNIIGIRNPEANVFDENIFEDIV